MTNERDRRDLEGTGPAADLERWESLVSSITARGEPLLAARRREVSLVEVLDRWRRPVYSASLALAAAALAALALIPGMATDAVATEPSLVAEAVVPSAWAAWLQSDYTPTLVELAEGGGGELR